MIRYILPILFLSAPALAGPNEDLLCIRDGVTLDTAQSISRWAFSPDDGLSETDASAVAAAAKECGVLPILALLTKEERLDFFARALALIALRGAGSQT